MLSGLLMDFKRNWAGPTGLEGSQLWWTRALLLHGREAAFASAQPCGVTCSIAHRYYSVGSHAARAAQPSGALQPRLNALIRAVVAPGPLQRPLVPQHLLQALK